MGVAVAPDWVAPFRTRQWLWQEYGVSFPMEFDELVLAIRVHGADMDRWKHDHPPAQPG